jgi:hypothetical protein
MDLFHYTPLNNPEFDLRFINISPGEFDERLSCSLYTPYTKFVPPGGYRALSYTWGDAARKVPIFLNGRTFLVTPNLEDALRNLRTTTTQEWQNQLPLWIDAICINQEDSDERDGQVRRMKWIYQQADHVIIWLGNYNEPSDVTLRIDPSKWRFNRIEENSEDTARSALVLALFMKDEASRHQESEVLVGLEDCQHLRNLQVWAQLLRLFHRPWFERLWIIQELAVSRKAVVLWGKLQTPWPTLEKAAKFILRPGEALLPTQIRKIFPLLGAHRITQVDLKSMLNVDTNNIMTVLHNTQNTKCSDPRDRLYAIRGIVEDNQDIEIDYSIPVQQVYRNWAEKRIRRTQTLDILCACADSGRGGDLPSWVPDLRQPFGQDKVLWIASQSLRKESDGENKEKEGQDSSEFQCSDLCFSDDGLKVSVSGQYLGKVGNLTAVGDVVTNLLDPTDLEARLRQIIADWERTLNTPKLVWGDELLTPKGFKETLLRSFYPRSSELGVLDAPYRVWCGEIAVSLDLDAKGYLREFERSLFSRVHGCQMFIMERSGRTGIVAGNCETQTGDELWLLRGGLTAFVLRRVNEVEHRLISPCYLFGKMYWDDRFFGLDYKDEQKVIMV